MILRCLAKLMLLMSLSMEGAYAASANQQLGDLLQSFQRLTADFQQTTYGAKQRVLQQASGTMAIARPNKFRWYTASPNKQLIVMDGKSIWVYDQDLEQASVRPMMKAQGNTPAMLLSGTVGDIEKYYRIQSAAPTTASVQTFTLTPLDKDGLFKSLTITFNHQLLTSMMFHDNLGQFIKITFLKVKSNGAIAPSQFQFKPPKGVDVIGATS